VKRLFAILVFFAALIAPLRSQQTQAVDYVLDGDGMREIALYPAPGYRSYVEPKYVTQSLEELEQRVAQLPPGTRLHWVPYKRDPSCKPVLFSDGQYDLFAKFCRDHNVELVGFSSQGIAQDKSQEQRQTLFVVRERLHRPHFANCSGERQVVYGLSYSAISVSADGRGTKVVWYVPPCSDPRKAFEWDAPANAEMSDFVLSTDALAELRSFLDKPAVKSLRDFLNAGYGVGDYQIEIGRSSGIQRVPVFSLMPEHDELKRDPTLIQVICKAKEIASEKRPLWCRN